jgi:hypothetical protein
LVLVALTRARTVASMRSRSANRKVFHQRWQRVAARSRSTRVKSGGERRRTYDP